MNKYVGRGCQIERLWLNGSTGRFCWCTDIQKSFYKCTYMFSRVTNELLNLIYLSKSLLLLLIYYFSFLNLSYSAAGTTRFICFIITAHKMKFSNKDFFSKCDQIRKKLQIWSHLLKKSLMEDFMFLCTVRSDVGINTFF